MNWTEYHCLIGLNLIPELTPRRMAILLERFSSPLAIWNAPAKALAALPGFAGAAEKIAASRDEEAVRRELVQAEELGVQIITILDPNYPPLLREIEAPPPTLYLKGEKTIDTARTIAVVGTRRSSQYGRAVADRLAGALGRVGLVVVSGLAVGIDAAAHRGTLKAGAKTVAVLGSGFGHPYPASNKKLADQICESGTLVSEYPLDTRPAKWTFPQRNRILSGLSRGVVVVEAPEKSGALITARLALEQGREVFAVPGAITSTASVGTNRLIKDGAKLVETVEDVLDEFPDLSKAQRVDATEVTKSNVALSAVQQRVYDLIGLEAVHIDDIIARGRIPLAEASHVLLVLQMENLIQEVEGRRYIRTP